MQITDPQVEGAVIIDLPIQVNFAVAKDNGVAISRVRGSVNGLDALNPGQVRVLSMIYADMLAAVPSLVNAKYQ